VIALSHSRTSLEIDFERGVEGELEWLILFLID
jgi:hypothetical protein